jgi:hypothetical protein
MSADQNQNLTTEKKAKEIFTAEARRRGEEDRVIW